jgi:hypothetical protein
MSRELLQKYIFAQLASNSRPRDSLSRMRRSITACGLKMPGRRASSLRVKTNTNGQNQLPIKQIGRQTLHPKKQNKVTSQREERKGSARFKPSEHACGFPVQHQYGAQIRSRDTASCTWCRLAWSSRFRYRIGCTPICVRRAEASMA